MDEECAAIPDRGLSGVWPKRSRLEVDAIPDGHKSAPAQTDPKFIFASRRVRWRNNSEIREDRIGILARKKRKIRVGKCRIEVCAIGANTPMHCPVKVFGRPLADAVFMIGADVCRVERPKRRAECDAAANAGPSGRVWQLAQSPSVARYLPRATRSSAACAVERIEMAASNPNIGAIALLDTQL